MGCLSKKVSPIALSCLRENNVRFYGSGRRLPNSDESVGTWNKSSAHVSCSASNELGMAASETIKSRTVLFLAYMFPPLGGGGVQRSLKFVKYLPANGWNPVVLSVRPISYYVYDPQLLAEVPDSVEVVRTHSLDPLRLSAVAFRDTRRAALTQRTHHPVFSEASPLVRAYRAFRRFAFFPDAQLGWIPFAFDQGLRITKTSGARVIYSPAAPYSSAVTAYLLSRWTGLPYVIDFRDGWTDDAYHSPPTALHRRAHRSLERLVVTNASAICVYGDWLGKKLEERYPETKGRITEITNGFDPSDFEGLTRAARNAGKVRIVYSGSLYVHHRSVFGTVLKAIAALPLRARDSLELTIVGQVNPEIVQDVHNVGLDDVVQLMGYLPHSAALGYVQSADATLLLVRKNDSASVTGKVFELLAARRPIIALAEADGECARILRSAGAANELHQPDDIMGVQGSILRLLGGELRELASNRVATFSRFLQTRVLADIFGKVSGENEPRPIRS
jgi:glycosyltransferase involved in cell wall biosynthesis